MFNQRHTFLQINEPLYILKVQQKKDCLNNPSFSLYDHHFPWSQGKWEDNKFI